MRCIAVICGGLILCLSLAVIPAFAQKQHQHMTAIDGCSGMPEPQVKEKWFISKQPGIQLLTWQLLAAGEKIRADCAFLPTPEQELILAIGSNDVERAKELLDQGVDPNNRKLGSGMTPLMVVDRADMARLLLSRGADPRLTDTDGATPLHYMVTCDEALDLVPLMLDAGGDINARAGGWSGETPFLAAKQLYFEGRDPAFGEKVLRLLVSRGADINAADDYGYTVLISAAVNAKPGLARLMLDLGADTRRLTKDGKTALDYACELKLGEIATLIMAADVARGKR